ncbi:MAG: hypothetical protein KDE28_24785, partial [Anaerolineales bacterium]|nr:hypothetical protein [Anaerolineales bacterium]
DKRICQAERPIAGVLCFWWSGPLVDGSIWYGQGVTNGRFNRPVQPATISLEESYFNWIVARNPPNFVIDARHLPGYEL